MSEKRHLHPAAALEYLVRNLKYIVEAAFPLAVALLSMKMGGYVLVAVFGVACLFIAYAVLHWLRFVYYVEGGELRVEQGVLVRKNTYIPFERIQSVHVSAGIVQRLFGLVKLEVETAGGDKKAEVSLSALTAGKAEQLRRQLEYGKHVVPGSAKETLVQGLSGRSLFVAASTTNGLWIMLLGLFALFSQLGQFFPQVNVYELLGRSVLGLAGSGAMAIVFVLATILLTAWVLSIVGSAIRLWGYTISREEDVIRISRGLLERNQYTLPVRRIQAIVIGESVLRQPFGLVSIEAVTAGAREKGSVTSQIFPMLRRQEVDGFLRRFVPEFAAETRVERVSRAAFAGYMVPTLAVILTAALAATALIPYGYYSFLLLVPAALWAYLRYRDAGWQLRGDLLIIRYRALGRATYLIAGSKIQSMSATRTFLQARRRLATLSVSVPTAYGGTNAGVAGIAEDRIAPVLDWFRARRAVAVRAPAHITENPADMA